MRIGVASEDSLVNPTVFTRFTQTIFDVISVKNYTFSKNLCLSLVSKGFTFGNEIERISNVVISCLLNCFKENQISCNEIFSVHMKFSLLDDIGGSLFCRLCSEENSDRYEENSRRLFLETSCFFMLLWEKMLIHGLSDCNKVNLL